MKDEETRSDCDPKQRYDSFCFFTVVPRVSVSPRPRVSAFILFDNTSLGGINKPDELRYFLAIRNQFPDLLESLRRVELG